MMSPNLRKGEVDSLLIKHMILNSIRVYNKRFRQQYGDIVICCDSTSYWRSDDFPHYKAQRSKDRKKSKFDWNEVFETIRSFKEDLTEFFPYRVIEVDKAEGDDVIAVLAKHATEKTLIIGGDKDYVQLHRYPNVTQYSPVKKEFIKSDNPDFDLFTHIVKGDKADGIPNIRSTEDFFVNATKGQRMKSISAKNLESWYGTEPKKFAESVEMLERFEKNQKLIDFDFIPDYIVKNILDAAKVEPQGSRTKIMEYFAANRMRQLLAYLGDF